MSPALNHLPTESSNTPPAGPSQSPKEETGNPSLGNSPQPKNDGIGQSAPQTAQEERGELRGVKRLLEVTSPSTSQGTHISPVPEPAPIDPSFAISSAPNTDSIHGSIIRLERKIDALLAGTYEGRSGHMCEGVGVGEHQHKGLCVGATKAVQGSHPHPRILTRRSNTPSADSSRPLIDTSPGSNPQPNKLASTGTHQSSGGVSGMNVDLNDRHRTKRIRVDGGGPSGPIPQSTQHEVIPPGS
jgi:hypothetical protein